jgi:AraC-like DNA-binding protein
MQRAPIVMVRSTDGFPTAERFPYWADVVTQTFVPLECDAPDRMRFSGTVRHRQVGLIGITDVQASAMRVRRTPATIARAPRDELIVVLHLDGRCTTGQRSDTATLVPGDGAAVATDECYFFEFPESFRQLVLKLPTCLLAEDRIGRDDARPLVLAPGPALLLQRLALSALDDPIMLSPGEEIGIERAFAELLRSASAAPDVAHDALADAPQYANARLFIREHLADAALNPAVVATYAGMSIRNLARLFARHGITVERTIWTERLAAAHRDLLDPRLLDRSITDIAFSWAFNDAAHFSRSFTRAYGVAPSALRAAYRRSLPRRRN